MLEGLVTGTERLVAALESSLGWQQGAPLRQRLDAVRRELERLVDGAQLEILRQAEQRKRLARTAGLHDRRASRPSTRFSGTDATGRRSSAERRRADEVEEERAVPA